MAERTEFTKSTTSSNDYHQYYFYLKDISRNNSNKTSPLISINDFNNYQPRYMSDIANQILHDESFDIKCKSKIEEKNRSKKDGNKDNE